jgi:hypothetical protein
MPRVRSISIQSDVTWRWRLAAADGAGDLDGAAVQQQLLGQGGLAGVGVGNDREGPPAPGLALDFRREAGLCVALSGHG